MLSLIFDLIYFSPIFLDSYLRNVQVSGHVVRKRDANLSSGLRLRATA